MTKQSKAERKRNVAVPQKPKRSPRMTVLIALAAAGLTIIVLWALNSKPSGREQQTQSPAAGSVEFQKLQGRWLRADGGYVLEIKRVDESGRMDAAYFNPRPINVARAEASRKGSVAKVFVELRDTNYPGSTYDLSYDEGRDELRGSYFQAALNQTFDVVFQRMK